VSAGHWRLVDRRPPGDWPARSMWPARTRP